MLTKLTLIADGSITIRNSIDSLFAGAASTATVVDISAPVVVIGDPGMALANPAALTAVSGEIAVRAPASLSLYSNAAADGGIISGTGGMSGSIDISAGSLLLSSLNPGSMDVFISAFDDAIIRATGNILLDAGGAEAQIITTGGGLVDIRGTGDITLNGGSAVAILSRATIFASAGGDLYVEAAGDVFLNGGTASGGGADGSAGIAITGGAGSVTTVGRNYFLTSGTGPATNQANIGCVLTGTGPVSVTSSGPSGILMTAQASQLATIGTFFGPAPSGDIFVNTTHLTMNASVDPLAVMGFAIIASRGNTTVNASGDIVLTAGAGTSSNSAGILTFLPDNILTVSAANIQLFGGSTMSSSAFIQSFQGPTNVDLTESCFIQAGSGAGAFAGITAAPTAGTGDLRIKAADYTLIGGSGMGASAALATGDPGGGAGGNGSVFVTATGPGGITLMGGSAAGAVAAIASFGTLPTNAVTVASTHSSADIQLLSSAAAIAQITTLGGGIAVTSAHDLIMTSAPGNPATISVGAAGSSDLFIQTDRSAIVDSLIANFGTGNLFLVVDAAFPTPPLFGPGFFSLGTGGILSTAGGAVRIFTSQQSLNSILGLINGLTFTAGTVFIDTNQEAWCVYYPSNFGGTPFTIFYKDCLQQLADQAQIAVAEELNDLHPTNEAPGWWQRFSMSLYNDPELTVEYPYFIGRRFLKTVWHPKSYTAFLHDTFD